jgi:hypothetical protein
MNMEPVSFTVAAAVATGLTVGMGALWRRQTKSDNEARAREKECNQRNDALSDEIKKTKDRLIDLQTRRAENAEAKAEMEAQRGMAMADAARTCAKVLKRFEQTPVPPSTGETSALHRIQK